MKALRIIGGILLILLAIFFIGGTLLPKTYTIHRSTLINATDSVVYMNVADLNNFLKWNPWTKMEPSAKVTISGTTAQPGHLWEWLGKETGQGQMELITAKPYSLLEFELKFFEPFESSAISFFNFEQTNEGTKVTWGLQGEAKNMGDRWMGLFMDMMMDKDFNNGLQSLKELSEK
ncbi:MAG: SRPBCC family protein [Daejeonella sp.]|uniref:SRPBCC family protein n=1 Tax=Daejeonella sp. TaxID=2805397 RepID=UPI002736B1B0|nr:SRPBCC family protein [Daejeonella sp.]MDP3468999.1 SRPBCC family protein [Daejeonella sp.]